MLYLRALCGKNRFIGHPPGFIRNKGKQYYTPERTQNVRQESGCLVIESLMEDFQGAKYTSGSINTLGKKSFAGPLYLLLNTAIGGGWGGEIDETILPQKFFVDYVRVCRL